MTGLRIDFAFPGNLAAPTGGYGYDRHMIAELVALGATVTPISLPASFPFPAPADLTESARLLSGRPRDALIIDGLAFGALPADLVAALEPAPIALVHHPLFMETGLSPDASETLRGIERAGLQHASAIVTTSRMTADIVAREFRVPKERLFVAEPGVEPAQRATSARDGIVRLVAVGSVLPRKGYDDLVRALAGVACDWRLAIVGSLYIAPDCVAALRARIAELGLSSRISLTGALTAEAVATHYAGADVFVTSSHFEGYGMAIAEAVARGLPIAATHEAAAAGAAPAAAMLTCAAGDVAGMRVALNTIVADGALRERMSDCAWDAALRQPRWRNTAQSMLRAIQFARGAA